MTAAKGAAGATSATPDRRAPGAREDARRERREEARRRRELAYKRAKRQAAIRRGVTWGIAAAVAVVAVWFLFLRPASVSADKIDAVNTAATAVGCTEVKKQNDNGNSHLAPGAPFTYPSEPATSGSHDPSPLPPTQHVYTQPVPETRAVHNLEHGYILLYYRADGDRALPAHVVTRLGGFATSHAKVILAPFPNLPAGTSLAMAAWDHLVTCPSTVTADQAATVAKSFSDLFNGDGDAPEPNGV